METMEVGQARPSTSWIVGTACSLRQVQLYQFYDEIG